MLNSILASWLRRDAIQQLSRLPDRRLDELGTDWVKSTDVDQAAGVSVEASTDRVSASRSSDWDHGLAPSWAVHNRRALIA